MSDELPIVQQGRIAGVDYGTVRIGIAIADMGVGIATPHETYVRRGEVEDKEYFRQLVVRELITRFVVGLPVHLAGGESRKSAEARTFGDWLQSVTGIPVEYYDERFTTKEAAQHLSGTGLTKKQRKARLDKVAAQIMLSAYLESCQRGDTHLGPLDDAIPPNDSA